MSQLKSDMIHGLFWSAIEKYSGLIVSVVISMILARLISPNEFGIVAVATVIIQFLSMFANMGIGPAVIQRKDLSEEDLNNIFSFSIFIGLILGFILFFASWPISWFYDNSNLVPVCQLLSINLFFAAANMVPSALMSRDLKFKQIAKRTLILQIISSPLAVIAAYCGAGVYALLISPIFTSIGIFFFNKKYYPLKLYVHFNLEPIKSIYKFSLYQFSFDFVNYFSRNLDKLIIGRSMNMTELGYYEKSYRLMQMPLNNLTGVISPVMQPVLSSLQDDKAEMSRKYNKIIRGISTISFPLGVILFFCSSEIITILFGSNWTNAIPVFQILCLSIPTQLILSTSGSIFQACNATNHLFWCGIRNTLMTVTGFVVAACFYGTIEAFAWAWSISAILAFFNTYIDMYVFVFKTSMLDMLKELLNPIANLVILIFLLYFISSFSNLTVFPLLVVKLVTSVLFTLLFVSCTKRYRIKYVKFWK